MYRERWLYMHYTYICSYACFRFCKGVPSGTHLKAPNTHVPNSCPWCDSGTVAGEWRIAWSSKCGRGTTIHGRGLHHNAYVMRSGVWLTLVRIILYRYIEKEIFFLQSMRIARGRPPVRHRQRNRCQLCRLKTWRRFLKGYFGITTSIWGILQA